jgi:tetratricopeptide (TPR) repeat protein
MTIGPAGQNIAARLLRGVRLLLFGCLFLAVGGRAQELSLTNLLAQGDLLDQRHDTPGALQIFLKAGQLAPTNAEVLCRLVKQYCDMMHTVKTDAEKKEFAEKSLDCARRAAAADPKSPQAHVCLAVCYAKVFPYSDNQTKVNYSREIKAEAEKAVALDPNYDLSYHMLGRWNCEVANMNLFLAGLVKIAYGGLPKASNQSAIDNFKKAIELAPNRIIHHLQLAHVYHITGEEKLAAAELQTCRELTPFDLDDTDARQIAIQVTATGRWPAVF